jgi:hypothetical protein
MNCAELLLGQHVNSFPQKPFTMKNNVNKLNKLAIASILPILSLPSMVSSSLVPLNLFDSKNYLFKDSCYETIGDMKVLKILNGMWQVSGMHGYVSDKENIVAKMTEYAGVIIKISLTLFIYYVVLILLNYKL